jgi:exodeoxyribonuclease III
MRIVSYNILDGGEGRADPLAEVIESQRPDLVALVEADLPQVVERIARRLNMDFIHAKGRRHGAAILSRWPILESINHSPLHKVFSDCLLEALIQTPQRQVTLAAVHLHPHALLADETIREAEIAQILRIFEPLRLRSAPHLLAGDFNANSPIQRIEPDRCKPRTRQDWLDNGNQLPRRAVQMLLDSGYVDSLHAGRGPEAGTIGSFSTQFPGQRVDYIFAHSIEPLHIREAWVEQDRLARYASDHFPVGVELGE